MLNYQRVPHFSDTPRHTYLILVNTPISIPTTLPGLNHCLAVRLSGMRWELPQPKICGGRHMPKPLRLRGLWTIQHGQELNDQKKGGFLKWGYPQIINFHRIFHEINHPAILGYQYLHFRILPYVYVYIYLFIDSITGIHVLSHGRLTDPGSLDLFMVWALGDLEISFIHQAWVALRYTYKKLLDNSLFNG